MRTIRPGLDCIGVGVAAAVRNDKGEIAFLHRIRGGDRGLWGLPGGKVLLNETLERAIAREVREELGVRGTLRRNLGTTEEITPNGHWISALFLIDEVVGEAANRLPTVHAELKWFPPGDAPEALTHVARTVLARLGGDR